MPMPMPGPAAAPKPTLPGAPAPGASATGPGAGGPASSPMATPQPMEGMQKAARVQISLAAKMLQQQIPHFPLESPEFDAVNKALSTLARVFGKTKDQDERLFPAETMNLLNSLGPGSKTPGQAAMAGAPGGAPAAPAPPPAA